MYRTKKPAARAGFKKWRYNRDPDWTLFKPIFRGLKISCRIKCLIFKSPYRFWYGRLLNIIFGYVAEPDQLSDNLGSPRFRHSACDVCVNPFSVGAALHDFAFPTISVSCWARSAIFQITSHIWIELPTVRFYTGKRAKRFAVRVVSMQMLVFSFHKIII